jgi:glycosyltransferase involved in cell wall biosynthesis
MSFAEVPVVTGVGSIGKIVKHGENGFVIRPRNEDDIVEAMVKLINDKRLRKQMAENAQRTVLENFNSETYISELNKIYSLV